MLIVLNAGIPLVCDVLWEFTPAIELGLGEMGICLCRSVSRVPGDVDVVVRMRQPDLQLFDFDLTACNLFSGPREFLNSFIEIVFDDE